MLNDVGCPMIVLLEHLGFVQGQVSFGLARQNDCRQSRSTLRLECSRQTEQTAMSLAMWNMVKKDTSHGFSSASSFPKHRRGAVELTR